MTVQPCNRPKDEPEDAKDKAETPVKQAILELLQKKYGVSEEDFITAEIEVVPAGRAGYVGFDRSLVGGYGQDDRICVYTALMALCEAGDSAGVGHYPPLPLRGRHPRS